MTDKQQYRWMVRDKDATQVTQHLVEVNENGDVVRGIGWDGNSALSACSRMESTVWAEFDRAGHEPPKCKVCENIRFLGDLPLWEKPKPVSPTAQKFIDSFGGLFEGEKDEEEPERKPLDTTSLEEAEAFADDLFSRPLKANLIRVRHLNAISVGEAAEALGISKKQFRKFEEKSWAKVNLREVRLYCIAVGAIVEWDVR